MIKAIKAAAMLALAVSIILLGFILLTGDGFFMSGIGGIIATLGSYLCHLAWQKFDDAL